MNPDLTILSLRQENGLLRGEIETLTERIRQLEDEIGISKRAGFAATHLSKSEAICLNVLMTHELPAWTTFVMALSGDQSYSGHGKECLDIFICNLRKKLRPFGIEIKNKWGMGFYLTAENKAKVKAVDQWYKT